MMGVCMYTVALLWGGVGAIYLQGMCKTAVHIHISCRDIHISIYIYTKSVYIQIYIYVYIYMCVCVLLCVHACQHTWNPLDLQHLRQGAQNARQRCVVLRLLRGRLAFQWPHQKAPPSRRSTNSPLLELEISASELKRATNRIRAESK